MFLSITPAGITLSVCFKFGNNVVIDKKMDGVLELLDKMAKAKLVQRVKLQMPFAAATKLMMRKISIR